MCAFSRRPSVETMTTDQLTPAQKAVSGLVPGYFDSSRLGLRRQRRHETRRRGGLGWTVRLGRRAGHVVVFRPS